MWWDRQFPEPGRTLRILAVVAMGGLAAGCLQPLYADRTVIAGGPSGSIRDALSSVEVEQIDARKGTPEARVAVELRNDLLFELTGGGPMAPPTHKLNIRMTASKSAIIVDVNTGRTEAEIVGIDVSYTLTDLATKKVVVRGTSFSRVSSDIPGQQQRFARSRAQRDAEDRAAKVIAEQIRSRLASHFVAGT
jgi:LPS-assembly lipoprotein